ncbi:MAG: energy-coupling factor ABC transporter permease, partial [Actinobacteria bacterium]|nr:energy-coupling factor ABC transporter permease [Actinomycetota bacterium]
MHVPDGFIDPPVSLAAGVLAGAGVALCLRGTRRELDERTAPLAGLVAAFVFAAQMINFPVAAGTSGHLLGGALAAILAGPWTGALCVAVVLLVQSLFFADGGLTALGVNITDMSLITVLVGWAVFKALVAVLPRTRVSVVAASAVSAFLAVPAASLGFVGFYALGGTSDVPVPTVLAAMTGVHVLIGVGEALITGATVASVLAVRPDLVHGARHLHRRLELRTSAGDAAPAPVAHPGGLRRFVVGSLLASLVVAGVVSFWASTAPDGLNKVAEDT